MGSLRFLGAAGLIGLSAATAFAQELPKWPVAAICETASAPGQCAAFERRAHNAVTGGWGVLPEAVKATCLASIKNPLDQSWRVLADCIEDQTLKGLDKRAVATAATPAEPVPPPKSVTAPTDVPAPAFAVPTAPPKVD